MPKVTAPNKGGEVRFSTSKAQQEFLDYLCEKTVLGRTPNEVAQYLFVEALHKVTREPEFAQTLKTKPGTKIVGK